MSTEKSQRNLLGIVCALAAEAEALLDWFPHPVQKRVNFFKWIHWTAPAPQIVMVISGPGKQLAQKATRLLIKYYSPRWLLNFGTAGAIASGLQIGDIVLAQATAEYEGPWPLQKLAPTAPELLELARFSSQIQCGPIVSANKIIKSDLQKQELYTRYQALCGDWESGVVMRVCREQQIAGGALRVISDLGNEQVIKDFRTHHRVVLAKASLVLKQVLNDSGIFAQCQELHAEPQAF